MDQDSTKPGPEGAKGSWRDRLGINKELPKIAEEFKEPSQKSEAASEKPPSPPPRSGAPLARPAPMAPRPNAAEFAERLRQQREAAERMAEQRVAEAKERAVNERPQAPPRTVPPAARPAPNAPKPRFGFAEEELRGARQEQPSQTSPRQWTGTGPAPVARPVFTADRQTSPSDPRLRPPPVRVPAAPQARNLPPSPRMAPPLASNTDRQAPRPARPAAPQAVDRSRRNSSADPAKQFDEYAQDEPHYREMPRSRDDLRGARSHELDYVEEESDDLFEDDQNYSPQQRRRATAQDYNNVYREFDEPVQERRRTGPIILIAALVVVGAIAGGVIYLFQDSIIGQTTSSENVPVVDEPSAPVKTEPENATATDDQAPPSQDQSTASSTPETQAPANAQKKQIYDRILGETTLEEQEQVVPSEEQPVQPGGEQSHGFDADPLPLPMPPSPGGGDQGSLEPSQPSASVASTKTSSETGTQQASPASATLTTEPAEPAEESEAALAPLPSPSTPPPADEATASPPEPKPEPVQVSSDQPAPAAPQKAPTAEQKIDSELAFAEQRASAPPPQPAGDGPVQIAQLPGFNASSETTTFTPTPQTLPDYADDSSATTQRRVRTIGTRDSDKHVFNPNRNFNRAKQVQVAQIEADPIATQSVTPVSPVVQAPKQSAQAAAPAPQPETVGQQAALTPAPAPASKPEVSHGAGSGFTIQLASYKSETEALAGFEQLRQQHGNLIGSLTPNVQKTDLGANGTFYRLQLGSFSTKEAAKKACSNLLAAGERDCLVKAR